MLSCYETSPKKDVFSGSVSLLWLENPKGLLRGMNIDWLLDWWKTQSEWRRIRMENRNLKCKTNKAPKCNMKEPPGKYRLPNPSETFIREDERRRGSRNRCKSGHIWPTNWNINLGILIYSVVKQIYVVLSARGASNISNQVAFRSNMSKWM